MEPLISDLGFDRLLSGSNASSKASHSSSRLFGCQRSNSLVTRDASPLDHHPTTSPSPYATATSASISPYQAPESLRNLKPSPKWDVYSFGIVLLELLTGRVFPGPEISQYSAAASSASDQKRRVLRLADVAIRADVESREESMLACFKLGFSCASSVPQKRPAMKEALRILEMVPRYTPYC